MADRFDEKTSNENKTPDRSAANNVVSTPAHSPPMKKKEENKSL
jgi:hypothetical protein